MARRRKDPDKWHVTVLPKVEPPYQSDPSRTYRITGRSRSGRGRVTRRVR